MKELFVPRDLMLKLEKKGFAEDCICGYNRGGRLVSKIAMSSGKDCSCVWGEYDDSELRAATWNQIINWFRKNHQIQILEQILGFSDDLTIPKYGVKQEGSYPISLNFTLAEAIEESLKLI